MTTQDTSKRINSDKLEQGAEVLNGIRTLSDYQPQRQEVSLANLEAAEAKMQKAQKHEAQLKAQYRAAIQEAREAEWAFHRLIVEAKTAVVAQYGPNSNQLQAIGRKKTSAYKRPVRKKVKIAQVEK